MRELANVAAAIFDHIDFVAIVNGLDGWQRDAGLRPQSGQNDLLSTALFDRGNEVLVVPGIHRSTLDGGLVRKDSLDLRPDISAETLAFHRAENDGKIKNSCRLCERDGVVDDRLAVEIGNAKEHLRLMVDQRDHAIIRGQQSFLAAFHLGHEQLLF